MRPLAVAGNVNLDLIMGPVDPWPVPGTEIEAETDTFRPGGSAGNTALAWRGLGVPHRIAGSTGDDPFGEFLRASFPESSPDWPVAPAPTTVSVGLTHPDGERTFFTTRGHLAHLTWPQTRAMLGGDALDGGVLLLCGCFLTPALAEEYDRLFDWADAHDIALALDTGWPPDGWGNRTRAQVRGWMARCRHLLLNEAEATALSGIAEPAEAARALARHAPASHVVVKRGPEGALARDPAGGIAETPAQPVSVLDTIGAGDIFNAGYLAAIAEGRSVADALSRGTRSAARAISTSPRRYLPAG